MYYLYYMYIHDFNNPLNFRFILYAKHIQKLIDVALNTWRPFFEVRMHMKRVKWNNIFHKGLTSWMYDQRWYTNNE